MQRQTVGSLGRVSSGRKRLLRTEAVVLVAPKGWRPKHCEAQVTRWHVAPRAVLAKRTRPASGDLLLPRVRAGYSRLLVCSDYEPRLTVVPLTPTASSRGLSTYAQERLQPKHSSVLTATTLLACPFNGSKSARTMNVLREHARRMRNELARQLGTGQTGRQDEERGENSLTQALNEQWRKSALLSPMSPVQHYRCTAS
ncbi:hypothetical protein HPB51_014027 [Rhipicephalus microplus]|uniref:Uncharacterized protein n=1 Tax=Rhipicephalus microplus TaxID=6941 RepID=A0A9J6DAL3_RHIMP|nr:hypothetical protein HPB51_014027 [Rhipicephalus microplus]